MIEVCKKEKMKRSVNGYNKMRWLRDKVQNFCSGGQRLFVFVFWSLFNARAMPNRCCDRLDKKQPDSRERVTLTKI